MNNEIKINVPEGMEIDKEHSTFECIKFKPKWTPKRGDIAATEEGPNQIILVSDYIKESYVGFDVKSLAVLNTQTTLLTMWNPNGPSLWVLREATTSEKTLFIEILNKQGYVYDPNDPRIIYKKEKELPKTWEEFCDNNPIKPNEVFITNESDIIDANFHSNKRESVVDANLLPSEGYAKAMLALCKLIQLRDCYNDGWQADWTEEAPYQCIFYSRGKIKLDTRYTYHCILVFKSSELRDTFYNNFKDLIGQAKLLL